MITIAEKPDYPKKIAVRELKCGDTFVVNDNQLFVVGLHTNNMPSVPCTRLGGRESGQFSQIPLSTMVLQVNLLVEITRL